MNAFLSHTSVSYIHLSVTSWNIFTSVWNDVSVNSNWVYSPPGNPRGFPQKTCPEGGNLAFESCPGAENSTRIGILRKMRVKLQKKIAWIKFLRVKTKTSWIFDLFRGLRVFSIAFFLVFGSIFWFCYHTYLTKHLRSCHWLVYIFEVFTGLLGGGGEVNRWTNGGCAILVSNWYPKI